MFRIESRVRTDAPEFVQNRTAQLEALEEFRRRLAAVQEGGPAASRERVFNLYHYGRDAATDPQSNSRTQIVRISK